MSRAGPNRSEAVADSRFPASFPRAPRKDQTGPRGPHAAALIVVLVVAVAGVLTMFAEVALGVVVALLSMIAARSVIAMRVARSMPTARRGAGPRPAGQLLQAAGVHRARVRRRAANRTARATIAIFLAFVMCARLLPSVPSHGGGRREKDRSEPEPRGGHLAHPFAARIPSARHRLEPCDP